MIQFTSLTGECHASIGTRAIVSHHCSLPEQMCELVHLFLLEYLLLQFSEKYKNICDEYQCCGGSEMPKFIFISFYLIEQHIPSILKSEEKKKQNEENWRIQ